MIKALGQNHSENDSLIDYLRITTTPGLPHRKKVNLLKTLELDEILHILQGKVALPSREDILKTLTILETLGGYIVTPKDFPKSLKQIPFSPLFLTAIGNQQRLSDKMISIVGGRNASFHAEKFIHSVSSRLAKEGFTIVSGFAKGIDAAAHKGAIVSGEILQNNSTQAQKNQASTSQARTIAVFAGGLDHIYPKEHTHLFHEIIDQGGLIISEMLPGTPPKTNLFPRRNRIVAGLGDFLIMAEANIKSGTMITAKYALDYGKDIYCVPGPPDDYRVSGCHQFIQNGAYLLHTYDDLREHLENYEQVLPSSVTSEVVTRQSPTALNDAKSPDDIINFFSSTPITIDQLALRLQRSIQSVQTQVNCLELDGKIRRHHDGRYIKD